MSLYTIRQTYTNHQTGEHWTRVFSHRQWHSRRLAQRYADNFCTWRTVLGLAGPLDESTAEVVELAVGGAA